MGEAGDDRPAGDVALEDPDDLGLGAALFQAALRVGLGRGSERSLVITTPQSAELAWRSPPRSSRTARDLAGGGLDRGDAAKVRPRGL